MKRIVCGVLAAFWMFAMILPASASVSPEELPEAFDIDEQLDALGKKELMQQVPEDARELMEETGQYDLSVENLLNLSPRGFFGALWTMFLQQLKKPLVILSSVLGVIVLCSLLGGLQTTDGENTLSPVFSTVSVLCILTAISAPILDCIVDTAKAIQQASIFMLSFIPMFAAALTASGQPITGATYNVFLFATCQVVSQVVSRTLIPLMGVYLAFCIVSPMAPNLNISSAASTIKSLVSWALGLIVTIFVGLLSVQTMVAQSADSVSVRTTKFLIGSFVPVVGSALSEAYTAAQGCLRLLKTSLGAYGILVAVMTFLPILLQTVIWYLITNVAVIGSDILGVSKVSMILKSCGSVLAVLLAIILCYALLIIVSTTVVILTGMGGT